jgi:hypothetical protein
MQVMAKNGKEIINPAVLQLELLLDELITKIQELQNYNQDELDELVQKAQDHLSEIGKYSQDKWKEHGPIVMEKLH